MLGQFSMLIVVYFITLLSNSGYMVSNFRIISYGDFGRKRSWPEVQSLHLLEGKRKTTKRPRIADGLAEIRIIYLSNTSRIAPRHWGFHVSCAIITYVNAYSQNLTLTVSRRWTVTLWMRCNWSHHHILFSVLRTSFANFVKSITEPKINKTRLQPINFISLASHGRALLRYDLELLKPLAIAISIIDFQFLVSVHRYCCDLEGAGTLCFSLLFELKWLLSH
jgi:hypothetical protein